MIPNTIIAVSSSIPQFIIIQIRTQADNPALLEGLEAWLRLGLLSDTQVRQLCQQYLSQPLPQPTVKKSAKLTQRQEPPKPILATSPQLNFIKQLVQSFKAELSVRWLLFLGLFMVVVSSGVLAASQWERFPALGQYGVLFAYTLGFFAASFWASRSSQLPLTAQTIRWVTLLLIPLNFWAMNGLGLWQNSITAGAVAIASIILTGIVILFNSPQRLSSPLPIINQLILSYLHLGWGIPYFPLIAVYIGIFSSTGVSLRYPSRNSNPAFIAYLSPFIFLLTRAVWVSQVPWADVGFAIGLIGWLLYDKSSKLWRRLAYGVLAISWLVSIESQPWQAFGISLLIIDVVIQSLRQFWQRKHLIALFIIGLQTIVLFGRLIPEVGRETIINTATQLTQSQNQFSVLISLSWFPYLILWVVITEWLHRQSQPKLARLSQQITLGFGCFLTYIGFFNPIVRSLNLLASTITLAVVTRRRPSAIQIYLTHIAALLTIMSWIQWLLSPNKPQYWAVILLVLMVAEWSLYHWKLNNPSSENSRKVLLESSAYLGFGLAGLSYVLLMDDFHLKILSGCSFISCYRFHPLGISWLITPIALTVIAYLNRSENEINNNRQHSHFLNAVNWSTMTCILLQLLTLGSPQIRLISLAISTIILFLNSRLKPTQEQAALTVGFALASLGVFLWEGVPGFPLLSLTGALVTVAILLNILWLCHRYLIRYSTPITASYSYATHHWGNLLCGFELISLTIYSAGIYNTLLPPSISVLIATSLTLIAIVYRGLKFTQPNTETGGFQVFKIPPLIVYSFSWTLELLMAQILSFTPHSTLNLAIANVLIGLMTQWLGNRLKNQIAATQLPNPWQIIPLCYGLLGILLRINHFDQLTGLMGLGVSVICLGVGCRHRDFKPLVYIGLFGISLSVYQLLFYQVLSLPLAQQILAFAALGTSLLYGYRVLSHSLTTWTQLSEPELKNIANLHWGIASLFWLRSLSILPTNLLGLGLGIGLFLIRYAIMQGRIIEPSIQAEIWIYLGITQVLYLIYSTTPTEWMNTILLPWMGAIISIISYLLYFLPWQNWGWRVQPWRRAALILPVILATISLFLFPNHHEELRYLSAIITIIFYLVLAKFSQQIRLTYFALELANLAITRELLSTDINLDLVWWITPIALSCLYIAQVDPSFKHPQQRKIRHLIRCLATGLICGTALMSYQWTGIIPGIFSLVAIFAGLGLRVRAFLYIGTATFLINAGNQLILLNSTYSFFKWIIGFIVGLVLMGIAAQFETRREQVFSLFQDSLTEFNDWE